VRLDPTLVRGMGYYTGPIFEVEHPGSGYSIAGGGRYDGMVGRSANEAVAACGFSIGFERIVDLVKLAATAENSKLALIYEEAIPPAHLVALQHTFIGQGYAVRLVRSAKKMAKLLDALKAEGFSQFAVVRDAATAAEDLEIRPLVW
jgi:histidyl-tRNA synthetase